MSVYLDVLRSTLTILKRLLQAVSKAFEDTLVYSIILDRHRRKMACNLSVSIHYNDLKLVYSAYSSHSGF